MTSPRFLALGTLGLALLWACSSDEEPSTTGTGGIDWSGAGAGGASVGGSGNTGGAGAGVGPGGSAPGGGNTGGDGTGGDGMGGATPTGNVLAVAVGPSGGITAASVGGAAWASAPLGEGSSAAPTMATVAGGDAVAVFLGATDAIRTVTWSGGVFSSPMEYAAGPARGAPAFTAIAAIEHLAYQGTNFLHYYDQAEPIAPPASPQSFGPSPPAIAALPGEAVVAFAGDDGSVYAQSRSGGAWQGAVNLSGSLAQLSPALVALEGNGPDLLLTWVNHDPNSTDHTKIAFASRTGSSWSSPALIDANVFTGEDIRLAALPGGDALLAYRGTDDKAYTARYSGGTWGAATPIATPNPDVAAAPGIHAGVDGYDAELCYAGADGAAYHVRLDGGGFTTPATIGGSGLQHCAIAAVP